MAADSAVNLVSRCSSLDEFVAAFRAYVHRDHVFVPTTGQVAAGTRGRIAITLADGTPVLSGEAEVLSSSAVPQGPYQKPGIRLRFVAVDPAARPILARLERARTEPGEMLADEAGKPTTGARTDIRAADGTGGDPTEAAMCVVVETAAPTTVAVPAAAPPRVDLTPKPISRLPAMAPIPPARMPAGGGVPGKSFKIPAIPSIPAVPAPDERSRGSAVPRAEATGPVSGDYTVPTDPPFRDDAVPVSAPIEPPSRKVSPAGKARNKTMLGTVRGRPPATESAPHVTDEAATTRMPPLEPDPVEAAPEPEPVLAPAPTPAPAPAPAPVKPAPPAASLAPPSAGRTFAKTLLGLPTLALPPRPPETASLDAEDGWEAPEESVGDRTEKSLTPVEDTDVGIDVDLATDLDVPALAVREIGDVQLVLPPEPPPNEPAPVAAPTPAPPTLPPWAPLRGSPAPLRAGPAAPTVRTPQSMLQLGAAQQTPMPGTAALPGMPPPTPTSPRAPSPPPGPPVAAVAPAHARRDAEPTEIVLDRDGTDQILLRRRRRRPVVIGLAAAAVVLVGVAFGVVLGSGGGDGKKAAEPQAAATPPPRPAPDAAPAAAGIAPPPAPPDAAVESIAEDPPPPPVEEAIAPTPQPDGCQIELTSTPPGATVTIGKQKLGKTPTTARVPCKKASATFSRPRYAKAVKAFTPKSKGATKVSVRLARPELKVKVTSQPSGATVTIGGKSVGKTPVTAKVPGFQAVTIKVTKPGYQSKTTKVTAKKNGTSVKVSLRRGN